MNAKLRDRQYILSDPPNVFYTDNYSSPKNTEATADDNNPY